MPSSITIRETLLDLDEGRVVLADDAAHRPVFGVSPQAIEPGVPSFVQIDRVTMLELERGQLDLYTAMNERCAGIIVAS
jgi:hypothetical protein